LCGGDTPGWRAIVPLHRGGVTAEAYLVNDPQAALARQLRAAIGAFLVEFAALESLWLGLALRALLDNDQQLVEHLGELMDLSGQLMLLDRIAESRQASARLIRDVRTITNRARSLLQHRNDIAHNLEVINVAGELVAGVRK
jgi:hypothetical protein